MTDRDIVPRTFVAGDVVDPPKDDTSALWLGAIAALGAGGVIWYHRRGDEKPGFT
jgi:hypothetical protein